MFGTVNVKLPMGKLSSYGFRGIVNQLQRSYLTNRKQFVNISNLLDINVGVSQGSTLGPLLFNILINDITSITNCKKNLYADDVFYVSDAVFCCV